MLERNCFYRLSRSEMTLKGLMAERKRQPISGRILIFEPGNKPGTRPVQKDSHEMPLLRENIHVHCYKKPISFPSGSPPGRIASASLTERKFFCNRNITCIPDRLLPTETTFFKNPVVPGAPGVCENIYQPLF
jgi:hypothetical protein